MLSAGRHLALSALLAGLASPLTAQRPDSTARDTTNRDTIMLRPVVVHAAAPVGLNVARSRTATKTDRLLRDVPQAVTVVSDALISDQAMQGMADVIRYIPGISMGQGEGHRDAPTIRGNSSTGDFFVDGVRDDAQYLRDLYNVERVESLRGSNAMTFGRGGGGGVINRVTKDAQLSSGPLRSVSFAGGSYEHRRSTLDLGESFGTSAAVRLNGLLESSSLFRDFSTIERHGINPAIAVRAGRATEIRVDYEHFADHRTVNRGIPSWQGLPSPAPINVFFGNPSVSPSDVTVDAWDATVEHGTESGMRLRTRTRVAGYDKFYQNVFPGSAVNAAGTTVNLSAYNQTIGRDNLFNQTDLTFALGSTGSPVRQTLLIGAEVGRQVSTSYRSTGYFNDDTTSWTVPFDNPTVTTPVTFRQSATDANSETRAVVVSLYAQDELSLGQQWQAVAGVRYDRFDLDFHNNRTGQDLARVDNVVSPRAGLVFKPLMPLSFYGTHSVSFLPGSGDQFGSLTATSSTLEPERFTNHEVGLKWDVLPNLTFTGGVYLLDRTNTSAPHPDSAGVIVQTGRQRSKGFEATLAGAITSRWQVAGALAVQRATITSTTSAAPAGRRVPLVPNATLSLWNRFQVTHWFGAGLGVIRQNGMYTSIDNAVVLPGFTRADLAAFVTVSPRLAMQLNVENLFDTRYYATSHGNNNIMPGAPRTVRLAMTATP